MRNQHGQNKIFRSIALAATLAAVVCLAKPALAANLMGQKFLQATGSTGSTVPGWLTLTGLIEFNGNGGAKSVALTLNYIEQVQTNYPIGCKLNTAGAAEDSYDEKGRVGTFTVTI